MSHHQFMRTRGFSNFLTWNICFWSGSLPAAKARKLAWLNSLKSYPNEDEVKEFIIKNLFPSGTPDMESKAELEEVEWDEVADEWREDWEGLHG